MNLCGVNARDRRHLERDRVRSEVGCASKCATFFAFATIIELPTRCALWCAPYETRKNIIKDVEADRAGERGSGWISAATRALSSAPARLHLRRTAAMAFAAACMKVAHADSTGSGLVVGILLIIAFLGSIAFFAFFKARRTSEKERIFWLLIAWMFTGLLAFLFAVSANGFVSA